MHKWSPKEHGSFCGANASASSRRSPSSGFWAGKSLRGQDEMADSASQLYEEEFGEGPADDLRDKLASVERAEGRLIDGTYGLSVESGEPIPDERLEAVPTVERAAEEQAQFERQTSY